MTKRKIFLILSVITGISNFLIPYLIAESLPGLSGRPTFIYVFLLVLIFVIIILIFIGIGQYLKCFWWIDNLTTKQKKVYHSDLGYFYIEYDIKREKTTLYEQKIFTQVKISEIGSIDPEYISKRIKTILDNKYKEKLEEEHKKKKMETWDGFLDIQGKRDQKIDQIIK